MLGLGSSAPLRETHIDVISSSAEKNLFFLTNPCESLQKNLKEERDVICYT